MIAPIDWLKEFVDFETSPEELGDIFHNLGFEPEETNSTFVDLEITPNRGDVLCIYGLARDLSAHYNKNIDDYCDAIGTTGDNNDFVTFSPEARQATPRFSYFIASGGKIGESDELMQKRLKSIGINPKNNIIDLTNYLMHESGQPLHAFDLDKINNLNLDFAKDNERVNLLGTDNVNLSSKNLVAYSNTDIVDLVGVSGASNSAISNSTTRILLQAAIIDPRVIRISSKSSRVQTPASYRYERGVDYNLPLKALQKSAQYLEKWGFKIEKVIDIVNKKIEPTTLNYNEGLFAKVTSADIDMLKVKEILENLGYNVNDNNATVPSWRQYSIKLPIDLVQDVLRITGYSNIKSSTLNDTVNIDHNNVTEGIRSTLQKMGLTETINYSFISDEEAKAEGLDTKNLLEIKNPLSKLHRYLRPSLKQKLISAVSANPWYSQICFFEIGNVFEKGKETTHIGIISTDKNFDFEKYFGSSKYELISPDSGLGKFYKLKRPCYLMESHIDEIRIGDAKGLIELSTNKYRQISKYPPVVYDVAILVDENINPDDVANNILKKFPDTLLVEPFDEYTNPKFGGKKSIALRITYQNLNHTLSAQESEALHQEVVDYIKSQYGATVR